jgi:hypothetical protein
MVALALLSACAMTPAKHALVSVAASEVVAGVGDVLQAEVDGDYEKHGGADISDADKAALSAHWKPLLAKYDRARDALAKYEAAIRAAHKRGDKSLLTEPSAQLLGAWAQLADVAEAVGVPFIAPPRELVKFVGGGR